MENNKKLLKVLVIVCKTVSDARKLTIEISKRPDVIGISEEYLTRVGATFERLDFENTSEIQNYMIKHWGKPSFPSNYVVILLDDVVLDRTVTMHEFLRSRPALRDIKDVLLYYDNDIINKAEMQGAIQIQKQKGRIVV